MEILWKSSPKIINYSLNFIIISLITKLRTTGRAEEQHCRTIGSAIMIKRVNFHFQGQLRVDKRFHILLPSCSSFWVIIIIILQIFHERNNLLPRRSPLLSPTHNSTERLFGWWVVKRGDRRRGNGEGANHVPSAAFSLSDENLFYVCSMIKWAIVAQHTIHTL